VASEKNPLAEYLTEKTAELPSPSFMQSFGRQLSGGNIGRAAGQAVTGAGLAGAAGLAGLAAQKLVDAVTKAQDFKQMLAYDAELAQLHQEDPRLVNQMFSTLRTFNPSFTKDPVVASNYVRRMASDPSQASGMAEAALQSRDKARPSLNVGEMMLRRAGGAGGKRG
jgi:hypothetical protein